MGSGDPAVPESDELFHLSGRPVTEAVVESTAETLGTDPLELGPLYDAIDPDVLEALVGGGADDSDVQVSFRFAGRRVTVRRGGPIRVGT